MGLFDSLKIKAKEIGKKQEQKKKIIKDKATKEEAKKIEKWTSFRNIGLGVAIFFALGIFSAMGEDMAGALISILVIALGGLGVFFYFQFKIKAFVEILEKREETSVSHSSNNKKTSVGCVSANKETSIDSASANEQISIDTSSVDMKMRVDPFVDEIVRKYYEIIFAMHNTIDKEFLRPEKLKLIAKEYIEKQLNESSDEEKIEKALSLFMLSKNSANKSGEAIFLREFNKELKDKTNYIDTSFDTMSLCYKEEIKSIEKDFEDILETIKNDPKVYYFGQGINERIYKKYERSLGKRLTQLITLKIVYKSLTSGNRLVQVLMQGAILTFFNVILSNSSGSQLESRLARGLAIIAVRALHFEKSPKTTNINNNEYRELLLSHNYYKKEYGPFVSKDKISDEIRMNFNYDNNSIYPGDYVLQNIVNFESGLKGYKCIGEILHLDNKIYNLTCNLIWKEAIKNGCTNDSGEDITNSQEVADIFTILNHYYVEMYGGVILG